MKKKPNLGKLLPVILIAGAAYAVYTYFRGKQQAPELMPPAPPALPPAGSSPAPPSSTTPAPTTPKPIMIGQKAITNKLSSISYSPAMTSIAKMGGSDGKGNIQMGRTAGTVISVNDTYKTALVENYTYPAQYQDRTGNKVNVYRFYLYVKDLNGDY